MGFYEDRVLPRIIDRVMDNKRMRRMRARTAEGLEGEVLEVGFGSGLNVPHYPPSVTRVQAVDPATVGRELAAKRVAASPVPVEYVGLDGEHLPLDDASVDHVLITWTMCTIPDVDQALREMRRVLRQGGSLHFVEHGRAPDAKVVRLQGRITPVWRHLGGGCHLNRPIDRLVRDAGFDLSELDMFYMKGPKTFGYMYQGVANKT